MGESLSVSTLPVTHSVHLNSEQPPDESRRPTNLLTGPLTWNFCGHRASQRLTGGFHSECLVLSDLPLGIRPHHPPPYRHSICATSRVVVYSGSFDRPLSRHPTA
ncbi:hypothetical protein TMatcc_004736 [Talaromyces marneffei ATCC 18224]